jgi:NAD(P)-dependent dehydrogenase (short-subunit alcohol dehydrogenase family)
MISENKTILITGANAGIGLATAHLLAKQNYNLIIICRDAAKGAATVSSLRKINPTIHVESFTTDLSDLANVRQTADAIVEKYAVIDVLINNAGYYPANIQYKDSIEKTLLSSHLGHMLLTQRLLPSLSRSSEARIINVSSDLHKQGSADRFFKTVEGLTLTQAYADAKLANILFTMALSKQMPSHVTTYSLHPGVVRTNFAKDAPGAFSVIIKIMKPFFIRPEQGAATSVYLASTAIENIRNSNGAYFIKNKPKPVTHADATEFNANQLWARSLEILKPHSSIPGL